MKLWFICRATDALTCWIAPPIPGAVRLNRVDQAEGFLQRAIIYGWLGGDRQSILNPAAHAFGITNPPSI